MPEWLPKLSWPDFGVFALTVFFCLAAARLNSVGDFLGRLLLPKVPLKPDDEKPRGSDAP